MDASKKRNGWTKVTTAGMRNVQKDVCQKNEPPSMPDRNLSRNERIQRDIDAIKSGRANLCTHITHTQTRGLMKAGLVTERELQVVNKW